MSGSRISFGRALFVSAALAVGCSRGGEAARESARGGDAVDARDVRDATASVDAAVRENIGSADANGNGREDAGEEGPFLRAKPVGGKSIGHTSVVFKLKLEGGLEAAYKPRSKRGNARYRGEVAAYRLGRALGLSNVPMAIARSFDIAELRRAVGSEAIFDDVVAEEDGRVRGALIPWIKGLDFVALERDPWLTRWGGWLARGGQVPDDERSVAAQISTMVVFDFVTGNWDRWSGGNVGIDATKSTLLYIDNDGAFFDPPPAAALARQLGFLQKIDRFSRAFVEALRRVDVGAAVGDESDGAGGAPLFSARVIAAADERRKKALSIIDTKIAKGGESETLFFP
jgi:hypothetical protein